MKFDLTKELKNLDGTSLKLTYGKAIGEILLTPSQEDGGSKYRLYAMAIKLFEKKEVELDKEEVGFILQKVERVSPPLIYGRIRDFLDASLEENKGI